MAVPPEPPQRSDAQRNRERILAVALDELTRGTKVSLSLIAKRAGVGQATMYRHFPDRDALVLAVYQREVEQLVAGVPDLLDVHAPTDALREWLFLLAKFGVAKAGLGEAMQQATRASGLPPHPGYAAVLGAIDELLRAVRGEGAVRADVTVDVFLLMIAGLWQVGADAGWQDRARLLVDIIVRGIAPDPGSD